jgi:hypothetical protein
MEVSPMKDLLEVTMAFGMLIFLAAVSAMTAKAVYDCFYP